MSDTPDYSTHLIKAENSWKPVYQLLCDRKDGAAILQVIATVRHELDLIEWLIRKHTKGEK